MLACGMGAPLRPAKAALVGRVAECARLDELLAEARRGHSAVLVLRGDPGGARIRREAPRGRAGRPALGRTRPGGLEPLSGLPELLLGGLSDAAARELLGSAVTVPMDGRVRERVLAETRVRSPARTRAGGRGTRPARRGQSGRRAGKSSG